MPCPLTQTWDAALAVRDAVYRVLGFEIFIIPVLLFTDTPPNQTIEEWAGQRRVRVLFGGDGLVDRLLALALTHMPPVFTPLPRGRALPARERRFTP